MESINWQNVASAHAEQVRSLEAKLQVAVEALEFADQYLPNIEGEGCCSGRDCACYGKPTNPEYYIKGKLSEAIAMIKAK